METTKKIAIKLYQKGMRNQFKDLTKKINQTNMQGSNAENKTQKCYEVYFLKKTAKWQK